MIAAIALLPMLISSASAYYCPYGDIIVDEDGTYRCMKTYTPINQTAVIVGTAVTGVAMVALLGLAVSCYIRSRRTRFDNSPPAYTYPPTFVTPTYHA